MLYLFTGQVRNGKTVSIVNEAKKYYDAGFTIFSNTHLNFPYIELKRKDIIEWEKKEIDMPPKSVMVISEIHAWFDSRNSSSSNNKAFSYFVTQLGKFGDNVTTGLTIIADTQFFTQMDIRGRRIVYKLIECKKLEEKEGDWIKVLRVWKKNNNLVLKTIKKEIVLFDKDDFALYDTQGRVRSQEQKTEVTI